MTADPSETAVTLPVLSTLATASLLLLQVTVLSSASSGSTVADSCTVSPSANVQDNGLTAMLLTPIGFFPSWIIERDLVTSAQIKVTMALLPSEPVFSCTKMATSTSPAGPESGITLSHPLDTLVGDEIWACQESEAVNFKVCEQPVGLANMPALNTAILSESILISGLTSGTTSQVMQKSTGIIIVKPLRRVF